LKKDNLPLVLATDASSFGIGVVFSHIHPDGKEKPIAFASKTLDVHQVRNSRIEKESLSIIFGVKKIHQYLHGRKFILLTDHKPLVTIFNPSKHLSTMTLNRLFAVYFIDILCYYVHSNIPKIPQLYRAE